MKLVSEKGQLVLNLFAALVGFAFQIGINFFISPYVVKTLGSEANGFIQLSSNFISYAGLVTIALNSMAGRFITIAVHQGDLVRANKYYTSVFYGNCIIAVFLTVCASVCVMYLDYIVSIPDKLIVDVKLLFTFTFANFLMVTAFSVVGVATFIKNKLYINSIVSTGSQLLRAILLISLFMLLPPRVSYIGITAFVGTAIIIICNVYYKRRLMPEVNVKTNFFDFRVLWELISSGFWNAVLSGGIILLNGLDLLIANLFINSSGMGRLALAKTVPTVMSSLAGTLNSVFVPSLTINYAKKDMQKLKKELKRGMKITGIILTIPLACLIVLGREFFWLWVPTEDAAILHILSVLTCYGLIFTCGIQCLYSVFTVVNKIRTYSLLMLMSGVLSASCVFALLNFNETKEIGLYIIAGTSSIFNIMRNMLYVVPYAAKFLGFKWNTFFPEVLYSILSIVILILIGLGVKQIIIIDSWISFIFAVSIMAACGFLANIMIVLNKDERKYLITTLLKYLAS